MESSFGIGDIIIIVVIIIMLFSIGRISRVGGSVGEFFRKKESTPTPKSTNSLRSSSSKNRTNRTSGLPSSPIIKDVPTVNVVHQSSVKRDPVVTTNNKSSQPKKSNTNAPTIFISYRRSDTTGISGRIYDRLITHLPKENVFKDVDSIPFGIPFAEYLSEQINKCDIVLVIIGDTWVSVTDDEGNQRLADETDFVRIEVASALQRKIKVVPVLVNGAKMPQPDQLPDSLKPLTGYNGIAVRHDPDFHNDMSRLLRNLQIIEPQ